MTVKELMERLANCPQDAKVCGLDSCMGAFSVEKVEVEHDGDETSVFLLEE